MSLIESTCEITVDDQGNWVKIKGKGKAKDFKRK